VSKIAAVRVQVKRLWLSQCECNSTAFATYNSSPLSTLTSKSLCQVGHAATAACLSHSLCQGNSSLPAGLTAAGQGLVDGSSNRLGLGLGLGKACRRLVRVGSSQGACIRKQ
jgi:hypothetical protein